MNSNHLKKQLLFILNPKAGSGLNDKIVSQIKRHINHDTYDSEIIYTDFAGHGIELSRSAADKKYFGVVAVGGDGTINEIAQSLKFSETALGIIPTGSGNGFARHLKIPVHIAKAIQVINKGNTILCDTFLVNDWFALNVSGIGFDAHIASLFSKSSSRGFKTYFKLVVKSYAGYYNKTIILNVDGKEKKHDVFITSFANSSQWGNNARIAPHANIQDGLLDVSVIRKMPFYKMIRVIRNLFAGKLEADDYITFYKGKQIGMVTDTPIDLHVDGEAKGLTHQLDIKVVPTSLKIIVP